MPKRPPGQTEFVVRLRALPDAAPSTVRLRRLLKIALRAFRLRCVELSELPPAGDRRDCQGDGPTAYPLPPDVAGSG